MEPIILIPIFISGHQKFWGRELLQFQLSVFKFKKNWLLLLKGGHTPHSLVYNYVLGY